MSSEHRIHIRQRQYGFSESSSDKHLLVTENILVCTAWFGFDKGNNLAFLCHFDSPKSAREIPRIIQELRALAQNELEIESYMLNGTGAANWLRTRWTRREINKQVEKLGDRVGKPNDLGYKRKGIRSLVVVSAKNSQWKRKDYFLQCNGREVSAPSSTMSKASGSA